MLRKSGHRLGDWALLWARLMRLLRGARCLRSPWLLLLRGLWSLGLLAWSLVLSLPLPLSRALAQHHANQVLLHSLQLHLLLRWR